MKQDRRFGVTAERRQHRDFGVITDQRKHQRQSLYSAGTRWQHPFFLQEELNRIVHRS